MQITGRVTLHFGYLEIWKWIGTEHIISHKGWFLKKHVSKAVRARGLALLGMWWSYGEEKKPKLITFILHFGMMEQWIQTILKQGLISELRIIVQWSIISSVFPVVCWVYTYRFGKRTEAGTVPCRRIRLHSKGDSYW